MENVTRYVWDSDKRVREYGLLDFLHWFSGDRMADYGRFGELSYVELLEIGDLVTPLVRLADEDYLIDTLMHNRGLVYRSLNNEDRLHVWLDEIEVMKDSNEANCVVLYALESDDLIVVVLADGVIELLKEAIELLGIVEERLALYKKQNG